MIDSTYYSLASKSSFNKALRHFFKVTDIVDEVESKNNIADVINNELDEEEIEPSQVLPIIGSVIKDKFKYTYDSYDIPNNLKDFKKIITETEKWTAMDILLVYFKPNDKVCLINPKNVDHWQYARELSANQLLVVYSKYIKEEGGNTKLEKESITAIEEMIAGKDVFINKEFIDKTVTVKKAAPKKVEAGATTGSGKRTTTPMYSIQVTNELFHNGNVEAWKRIMESYKNAYPDLHVDVFYENEQIHDLNALFQWGKVKHGGLIFIQVAGENIRGVSKLQKYLFEGASQRYEIFLEGSVGSVLQLF